MKVFILFDNDHYYDIPVIAVASSQEKADALKEKLQLQYTQEISCEEWEVDEIEEAT